MKILNTFLQTRSRREKLLLGAVAGLSGLLSIIMVSNSLQHYAQQASARLVDSERQLADVREASLEQKSLTLLDLPGLRDALTGRKEVSIVEVRDANTLQARFSSWQSLSSVLADVESRQSASFLKLTVSEHDGDIILTAAQDDE